MQTNKRPGPDIRSWPPVLFSVCCKCNSFPPSDRAMGIPPCGSEAFIPLRGIHVAKLNQTTELRRNAAVGYALFLYTMRPPTSIASMTPIKINKLLSINTPFG
jgi:hypothetical protein